MKRRAMKTIVTRAQGQATDRWLARMAELQGQGLSFAQALAQASTEGR